MPNADMNRLMDHARIRLPGALDSAIKMEMFSVMNEFFQASSAWYEDISFSVTPTGNSYFDAPGDYTYTLVPTLGSIVRLVWVMNSDASTVRCSMPTPGEVILANSPDQAQTYLARVILTVTDPVTTDGYPVFPAWVLNKYGNEILDGVLGAMMSQIAKPYTSPAAAVYHLKGFRRGVRQAKGDAIHGNLQRGQNWQFPQTFARTKANRN